MTDSMPGASQYSAGLCPVSVGDFVVSTRRMNSMAFGASFRSRQHRILEPILCGGIGRSPPSGDTPCYHPAGQKASAHALLDGCGWAPTVPSPTLFNPGASAEVTPGCGELPALVSMLLANYCDGEALHVYQPSLPPRIAIRGLDCSAL